MSIFRFKKCWQSQGQGGYYYAALVSVDSDAKGPIDVPAQVDIDGTTCAVEEISENAFKGCVYVTSVTCPDSVKTIGKRGDAYDTAAHLSHAFNCCCSLVCVSISNNVTFIGMASFEGCPHLKHFVVRKVQEKSKISGWMMPKEDFEKCTLYTNASDIINNKTTAVFGAKKSESELPSIEKMLTELESIPKPTQGELRFSLWTAHQTAWRSWSDAKVYGAETSENIIVPEVVFLQKQEEKFICSLSPKDGFSPYIVSSVGSSAFRGRQNLKTIYLPDTIKEIGDRDHSNVASTFEAKFNSDCFDGCSKLESINMPDRVSFIGTSPFSNCSNLKKIIIRDTGLKQMAVSTWRLNKTECQNIEVYAPSKYVPQIEKLKVFKVVNAYDSKQLKTASTSAPEKQPLKMPAEQTPTQAKRPSKKSKEQTPAAKQPTEAEMKALDRLINAALEDFVVTDEERATLLKKADSIGLSRDEFKMILDSRIQKRMKEKPDEKIEEKKKGFFARLFGK